MENLSRGGLSKKSKWENINKGWEEAIGEAEEEIRPKETEEAMKEMKKIKEKKMGKETTEALEEMRETVKRKGAGKAEKGEVAEMLEEVKAIEETRKEKEKKQLRKELAEKEEGVKPEQIIEETEIEEEKTPMQKRDKAMAEYLKHAISDHPELLTPEIKKNLDIITKQEAVIMKNEGSAKKDAQEKVRNAKEIIKRAQPAVNEYAKDIIKDYKTSAAAMNEVREEYEEAQDKLFSEKYDNYDVGKSSIARFFKERKLKKTLKPKDFEKFEEFKLTYYDAFGRYDKLLKKHAKKYGRLEDKFESGTSFQIAHRGGGGEKLPGVRGR